MKFALQLTALALASASASVYAHELRGQAVMLADVAATDSKAESSSSGDFFPPEEEKMDKADLGKNNSAQKRQNQRDARRYKNDPDRTQEQEDRERQRKYNQSRSRGSDRVDPNDPNSGNRNYARNRDERGNAECNRSGRGCNYSRDGTVEPNPRRRQADRDCIRNCGGSSSCERRCAALDNVEDVEYIADFLKYEDVELVAKFLRDAFDDDEDSGDSDDSQ